MVPIRSIGGNGLRDGRAASPNLRGLLAALGSVALGAASRDGAWAQVWPSRPIRLIVPFPPGGGTDVISRQLAERIGAATGWTLVIENRAAAGGNIGLDAVAKASPDGYTIGMARAANLAINPALYAQRPFDPLRDLAPIGSVASQGLVVVVSAKSPVRTLADLVAAGRQSRKRSPSPTPATAPSAISAASCSPALPALRS